MRHGRVLATVAVSVALGTGLLGAPGALADHVPPNGCGTPTVLYGTQGTSAGYAGVCTPLGSLVVGGDTSKGAYVYGDGADSNPSPINGYAVIGVKADGTTFCQLSGNPGQWNERYEGPAACVV